MSSTNQRVSSWLFGLDKKKSLDMVEKRFSLVEETEVK